MGAEERPDITSREEGTIADQAFRAKAVGGGVVSLAAQALQFVVLIGAMMALGRLLTPRDFGVVAMAMIVISLVNSFRDFGLTVAISAKPDVSDQTLNALFRRSIWIAVAVFGITAAAAPVPAWFFATPEVTPVVLVLAATLFVQGLTYVHVGVMRSHFHFKAIAAAGFLATTVGAAVAVAAAWLGFGYWSLVLQQGAGMVLHAGVIWYASPWRPSGRRRVPGAADPELDQIARFGLDTIFVRILNEMFDQLDRVIVGRIAGAVPLGLYQTARRWSDLPFDNMMAPIRPVVITTLSRLQDEPARYRDYLQGALLFAFTITLPAACFLVIDAREVLLILIGPQWLGAVPLFELLAATAVADVIRRMTGWIYLSESRTRQRVRWTSFARVVMAMAVGLGALWGPYGVAAGVAAANILMAYPAVVYCMMGSPLGVSDFFAPAMRPAAATVVAGTALFGLRSSVELEPLLARFVLDGAGFAAVYIATWIGIPGGIAKARDASMVLRQAMSGAGGS